MHARRLGDLVLLGAGGHAAVVACAARAAGWTPVGLFSDDEPEHPSLEEVDHLGAIEDAAGHLAGGATFAVHAAVGDAQLRRAWLESCEDADTPPIVHPRAIVSPEASIRGGAFVGPGAIVNANAVVDRGGIVNSGAIIEHDVHVGAFAHVAPGAVLGGAARVGADALVGLGACVMPRVEIGRGATLGAGAVAVRDVAAGTIARGVPAR